MATLTKALEQLDSHGQLQDAFCSCDVSLWVGLGLSLRALGSLGDVLEEVVSWLQGKSIESGWPAPSQYSDALEAIRTNVGSVVRSDVDLVLTPIDEWSNSPTDLGERLQSRYSQVLGAVDTRLSEDLRKDVLRIPETYADPGTAPTAEHRLLALLLAEGLVARIISTNWDDLIEKACEAMNGPLPNVIAGPEDVPGSMGPPFIAKIHGCARKAGRDPAHAEALVLTAAQIGRWSTPENQALRTLVDGVIRNGRCCFVGLSAQDYNLQQAHFEASSGTGSMPGDRLPTFAELEARPGQELVLAAMDPGGAAAGNMASLVEQATLGVLACDVLGAAYFNAVFAKLQVVSEAVPTSEASVYRLYLVKELSAARARLAAWLDRRDDDQRWDVLAFELSSLFASALSIFRQGRPLPDAGTYSPLTRESVSATALNPNLPLDGFHRLLWAVLALVAVARDESIDLRFPSDPGQGQLSVGPPSIATRVFVVHPNTGGAALQAEGLLDGDAPVLVIHTASSLCGMRTEMPTSTYPGRLAKLSRLSLDDYASSPEGVASLSAALLAEMPAGR